MVSFANPFSQITAIVIVISILALFFFLIRYWRRPGGPLDSNSSSTNTREAITETAETIQEQEQQVAAIHAEESNLKVLGEGTNLEKRKQLYVQELKKLLAEFTKLLAQSQQLDMSKAQGIAQKIAQTSEAIRLISINEQKHIQSQEIPLLERTINAQKSGLAKLKEDWKNAQESLNSLPNEKRKQLYGYFLAIESKLEKVAQEKLKAQTSLRDSLEATQKDVKAQEKAARNILSILGKGSYLKKARAMQGLVKAISTLQERINQAIEERRVYREQWRAKNNELERLYRDYQQAERTGMQEQGQLLQLPKGNEKNVTPQAIRPAA